MKTYSNTLEMLLVLKWEKRFAWWPIKIHDKWHWLTKVYRREIPKSYVNYDDWTRYEYGTIFDVLINDEGAINQPPRNP